MDFSEKLRKIRKEHGMSQEEFANQLNVSRQAVSKWESGQGFPETEKILMIGNIFSVSLDYLLKDSGNAEKVSDDDGYYVSREAASGYLEMKKHGARRIALGIAIIILSVSFVMLFDDAIGTFLFFICVAAGVAVLVLQGFRLNRYEEIGSRPLIFDADFIREFRAWYAEERKRYGVGIVAGIALIIASFAVNTLLEDILKLAAQYEAVYPIFWASGVALIIINASAVISCGVIAKNEEHIAELTNEKRQSWVFGVGFSIAGAAFLCIGFVWDKWHPGWVVFPVAALLCVAVSVWRGAGEKYYGGD